MEICQVFLIIFVVFAFSRSLLRYKDKTITLLELGFWTVIWILIVGIALLPHTTDFLTKPLGIARGIDLIVYGSIVLLYYLLFRLYIKMEQINQAITKIVRELAKEKYKK